VALVYGLGLFKSTIMYSSLKDYLKTPDPAIKEQGIILFARDYGIEETVTEIWDLDLNIPILGLGIGIEKEDKIYHAWELELPNHEIRLTRIDDENDMIRWVREERIDNAREVKEAYDLRMSKEQFRHSLQKRHAVKKWATDSLRKWLSKVIAWHQVEL
jgi:hypothetical protein